FIDTSNELGGFESGVTAAWLGPVVSVVAGGIITIVVVLAVARLWPELREMGNLAAEDWGPELEADNGYRGGCNAVSHPVDHHGGGAVGRDARHHRDQLSGRLARTPRRGARVRAVERHRAARTQVFHVPAVPDHVGLVHVRAQRVHAVAGESGGGGVRPAL